jgi:hypothetical protein
MKAEITYNAGASYRVKAHKFPRGRTVLVTDRDVILKCQQTTGFSVNVLERKSKKKSDTLLKKKGVKKSKKVVDVVTSTE